MDCRLKCNFSRVHFKLGWRNIKKTFEGNGKLPVLERRVFVGSLFSGFFLSRIFSFQAPSQSERLLRPPGVTGESDFQKKCVRCGECMKVCLRSALYPAAYQAGIEGFYTAAGDPAAGILRIQLHPLRPGLPDRGDPGPAGGGKKKGR